MSISYAKNVGLVKTPPIAKIGNNLYRLVNFNGLQWIAEELKETIAGVTYVDKDGLRYYNKSNYATIENYVRNYGFRLPTRTEVDDLFRTNGNIDSSKCKSICITGVGWNNQGNNSTTFNLKPTKSLNANGDYLTENYVFNFNRLLNSDPGWISGLRLNSNGVSFEFDSDSGGTVYTVVRLVKI